MRWQNKEQHAAIPMRVVGPVKIIGEVDDSIKIPLATLETPLWSSVHRGARVCTLSGGIKATLIDERMTRSLLLESHSAADLHTIYQELLTRQHELQSVVSATSKFAQLLEINAQIVGSLLYLRLEFSTGDAAGHNMVTLAADHLQQWLLAHYPSLNYVSISANYCTDKKTSAVNGILGRGKNVIAEVTLPADICARYLHCQPEALVNLHIKKNLMGSIVAGGLRSANAHFANILLGFYLATGQDAANIIEGSQGMVHTEVKNGQLYFSVTLPNLIVGTVGNGKSLDFVQENLTLLGCKEKRETGKNARRLAIIAAAAVLCGELSLLAAQTNPGELMRSHIKLERVNRLI